MGLSTGIGIGIGFNRGSQSWESYWASQPEVLFFGLYSEISGGQMPNKVTGSSDYLTVAGSAGSETYQAPNTASYQSADTDYIWFKTDTAQRTTTTAELIGYDFTRTIVKYANASPYAIEAIMILSSDVDTDKMRDDFDLSIWWDNTLNAHGNVKGNRGSGQSVWTPETAYHADSIAYFDRLTTPLSAGQQTLIDTFIKAVNTGMGLTNLSDAFDVMTIMGNEDSDAKLKNLVKAAHDFTLAGTPNPTFVALEGYTSDGTHGYINTNYNPSTEGSKFIQDSCSFGVYSRTNSDEVAYALGGSSSGHVINLNLRQSDVSYFNINQATVENVANTDSSGMFILTRLGATNTDYYRNKTKIKDGSNASATPPNRNLYILCANVAGTPLYFTTRQESFVFFGRGLSQTDVNVITNAFEAYMDANSKGVI